MRPVRGAEFTAWGKREARHPRSQQWVKTGTPGRGAEVVHSSAPLAGVRLISNCVFLGWRASRLPQAGRNLGTTPWCHADYTVKVVHYRGRSGGRLSALKA